MRSDTYIVPFEEFHVEQMSLNELVHAGELDYMEYFIGQIGQDTEDYAFTLMSTKYGPIAIFGGTMIAEGVAEVWSIMSNKIEEFPCALVRSVRYLLALYRVKGEVKRYQMNVRSDADVSIRFAKFFGFNYEGKLKAFGPDGADYLLFGRG